MSQTYPSGSSFNVAWTQPQQVSSGGYVQLSSQPLAASHSHSMPPPSMPIGCDQCGAQVDRNDLAALQLHARWHQKYDALLSIWDTLGDKIRATVRDDLEDLMGELDADH